jgi:hypothetical protein
MITRGVSAASKRRCAALVHSNVMCVHMVARDASFAREGLRHVKNGPASAGGVLCEQVKMDGHDPKLQPHACCN